MALKTLLTGTATLVLAATGSWFFADVSLAGAGSLGAFGVAYLTALFLLRAHGRPVQTIAEILHDVERAGDVRPPRIGRPPAARPRHDA